MGSLYLFFLNANLLRAAAAASSLRRTRSLSGVEGTAAALFSGVATGLATAKGGVSLVTAAAMPRVSAAFGL